MRRSRCAGCKQTWQRSPKAVSCTKSKGNCHAPATLQAQPHACNGPHHSGAPTLCRLRFPLLRQPPLHGGKGGGVLIVAAILRHGLQLLQEMLRSREICGGCLPVCLGVVAENDLSLRHPTMVCLGLRDHPPRSALLASHQHSICCASQHQLMLHHGPPSQTTRPPGRHPPPQPPA